MANEETRNADMISDGTQGEMPFAMVQGEPVSIPPQDLYIPPDALEVFLDAFEGPLDLLLYLIKRQNLDILSLPIAKITQQYMDYIGNGRAQIRAGRRVFSYGCHVGRNQIPYATAATGRRR
jgi:hypothetical protein